MKKVNKNFMIAGNSLKSNTQLAKQRLMGLAIQTANRMESQEEKFTKTEFLKRKRKVQKAKADRKRNRHQQKSTW